MARVQVRGGIRRGTAVATAVATGVATLLATVGLSSTVGSAGAVTVQQAPAVVAVGDERWEDRFALPGTGWEVLAVVEDGADVYVGGTFHTVGGQPFDVHTYLAHWDGRRWHQLGLGVNGAVTDLAVDAQHRLYVAGEFTSAGGAPASRVAMWDGSWHPLGSGVDGPVADLLVDGTDVYVGGKFNTAGGVAVDSLARWSSTSSTFSNVGGGVLDCFFCGDGGVAGQVHALAKSGSTLYVAGDFNRVNRAAPTDGYSSIAAWNGSSWSNLAGGLVGQFGEGNVTALALSGSILYAGGDFTGSTSGVAANNLASWNGSGWARVGSGAGLDLTNSIPHVNALEVVGGALYVGGSFGSVDGVAATHLVRWSAGAWSPVGNPDGVVYALEGRTGGGVYAGGVFEAVSSGKHLFSVGAFDGTSWWTLGQGAVDGGVPARGQVRAVAHGPDGAYAAGSFRQLGDAVSGGIARWDGTRWQGLQGGLSRADGAHAYALATLGDDVYVAGRFTHAGGVAANNIARWRPDVGWSALGTGTNNTVRALTVLNGKLYAAGNFSAAGGISASSVARFDPTTGTWSALPGAALFDDRALALTGYLDRHLVIGGDFQQVVTPAGVQFTNGLTVFDTLTNRWLTAATTGNGVRMANNLGGTVRALAIARDHLYVGGTFDKTGAGENGASVVARSLVKYDLITGDWEPAGQVGGFTAEVDALSATEDAVWAGGSFSTVGGVPATGIAELRLDGGSWSALGSGVVGDGDGRRVMALGQAPGRLWVGGHFVYAGGKPAASISALRQPPGVVFTAQPPAYTGETTAALAFEAVPAGPGVTFTCSLDGQAPTSCTSPRNLHGLAPGEHSLVVTASDATGTGLPATATWTVLTPPTAVFTSGPEDDGWSGTRAVFGLDTDQPGPATFTCKLDLGSTMPCTSPYTASGLAPGEHTLTARASNAAGPGPAVTLTWTVDSTPPVTKMVKPASTRFTLSTKLSYDWTSTDTGSGPATWDARWRRAPYSAGYAPYSYPTGWQKTGVSAGSLNGASPGSTYCVSARARDAAANLGAWSGERCWAVPLDDRSLVRSAGWSTGTGSAYYRGTHTTTTRKGATLTRTGVRAKRYALVATRCSTCGKVAIYSGTRLLKTVSLYRATTQRRYVVTWSSAYSTGTVRVKVVSSGKKVQLDGLGLSRS